MRSIKMKITRLSTTSRRRSLLQLREVIHDRFPSSRAVLIKYRDEEGDLVTITSDEELRLVEMSAESHGQLKMGMPEKLWKLEKDPCCIDDWIIEFAQLFKNYVGFDSNAYLNLHELAMKEYNKAKEDTVTSEEAQDLFDRAAEKFQEMTALALFNWGNVHMSRTRKTLYFTEDASRESILEQIKTTYHWAQSEYSNAGKRYEEALRIKPNFYEALLALGQQQFEQAKLSWYYAIGNSVDLETWPWKMGLDGLFKNISADEAAERAVHVSAQINILWGNILYERSIMEFKLGLPVWHEWLEVAVEKFEHTGASPTDIAVMVKNHCSNNNALEGLGFKIDEIIQTWNEMYEAKKCQSKIPSFRLEPLLRRRVSKIYHALEHA
ncbi:hypothetical protein DITRI_Ditri07aG0035700 [Diplodiscus trichospermus]